MTIPPERIDDAIEIPSVADLERRISCPACREPIYKDARICIHCKSDLTFKRYLPVGSNTLAMMTAFIAVVAAVSPTIKKQFFEIRNSDISAVLVQEQADSLLFLATNNGTRVGAITAALVEIPWLEKREPYLEGAANVLNEAIQKKASDAAAEARKAAEGAAANAKGAAPGSTEAQALLVASANAKRLTEAAKSHPTDWTSARVAAELAAIESSYKNSGRQWTPIAREYLPESKDPYFLLPGSTEPKKFVPKNGWYSGSGGMEALLNVLPYPLSLLDFKKCRVTIKGSDANGDVIFKTIPLKNCTSFVHALEAEFDTQYISPGEWRAEKRLQ